MAESFTRKSMLQNQHISEPYRNYYQRLKGVAVLPSAFTHFIYIASIINKSVDGIIII